MKKMLEKNVFFPNDPTELQKCKSETPVKWHVRLPF